MRQGHGKNNNRLWKGESYDEGEREDSYENDYDDDRKYRPRRRNG